MGEILAVINQKGGVGKTTTVYNMGIALKKRGAKVLLVDMDPQCNLSFHAAGEYDNGSTVLEMMMRQKMAADCIQKLEKIDLIAGSSELSQLTDRLSGEGKEYRLRESLATVKNVYDYIIIDSPPALSLLTVNILTACTSFIITAQADVFSMQGIGQLYSTYEAVRSFCNPDLKIDGILFTRYVDRFLFTRRIGKDVYEMAAEIQVPVFKTTIRESVKVREAAEAQQDIYTYAKKSKPAEDYEAFTEEFLKSRSGRTA